MGTNGNGHTKEALFAYALDKDIFDPGFHGMEDVRSVLIAAGFTTFNPAQWYALSAVLMAENEKRKQQAELIQPHVKDPLDPVDNPECPIGHGRRWPVSSSDHGFGRGTMHFNQPSVWACDCGERRFSHFIIYGGFLAYQHTHPDAVLEDFVEKSHTYVRHPIQSTSNTGSEGSEVSG